MLVLPGLSSTTVSGAGLMVRTCFGVSCTGIGCYVLFTISTSVRATPRCYSFENVPSGLHPRVVHTCE